MANYSYLMIGEKEVLSYRWDLPSDDDLIMRIFFGKEDIILRAVVRKPDLEDVPPYDNFSLFYYYTYSSTVEAIKKRIKKIGLDLPTIDQFLSKSTGIPIEYMNDFLLRYFYDTYEELFKEEISKGRYYITELSSDEPIPNGLTEDEFLELGEQYDSFYEMWEDKNLGLFPELRYLAFCLEKSDNKEIVELDPIEVIDESEFPDEAWKPSRDKYKKDNEVRLTRAYMHEAWIHYSQMELDLSYIEMFIALESAISDYLEKLAKSKLSLNRRQLNLNSMMKKLSLIDTLKFIWVYVKRDKIELPIEDISAAYDVRNTIIHRNAKRLDMEKTYHSLRNIELAISYLSD